LDVRRNFVLANIESNIGSDVEPLHNVEQRDHVLDIVGDEGAITRIPFVDRYETTQGDIIYLSRVIQPTYNGIDHEFE